MSIDRWMDKEDVVHTYNGILMSHKKENNAICSNMDATRDYHTKWSISERESQIPYDIIYVWNLLGWPKSLFGFFHKILQKNPNEVFGQPNKIWHKWTYLWNRNRISDIEKRLVVAKGQGIGGGMEREVGVRRYKLLYREQINSKVLVYSTESYIQYHMINHNGKEY